MGEKVKLFRNWFLIALIANVLTLSYAVSTPCALRQEKYGGVCVCTPDHCDYLDDPSPDNEHEYVVVSSSKAGLRFATSSSRFNLFKRHYILDHDQLLAMQQSANQSAAPAETARATNPRNVVLRVNREKQYQKIVGIGGSFTGAVSHLLDLMPQKLQDHIYKSYHAADGIGFNLMRMSIGGCDFDLAPWAYNETPEDDPELTNFNDLDPRDKHKIEQIKRLIEVSEVKNMRIKGAAWSSPRWMKTNNRWTGYGQLKKEYYQAWADYHVKWLELMEKNGLPIWAISTGNEPTNGMYFMLFVKFMSLGWTPKNQAVWLSDYLGPAIRNSKFKDVIIFGSDDQRYSFEYWFNKMSESRAESLDFLDGLAVHWYWDEIFKPSIIDRVREKMPDKILLTTESCIGDKPWQKAKPTLGSWARGEKYTRAFLQDFQHGFHGWIDWNIVLDETGGPNYVDNTVDAPMVVIRSNPNEVLKQPMFYHIGHFSKFVPEGSIRIDSERTNVNIDSVAFLRPDNSVAIIVFNSGYASVNVNIEDSVRGPIALTIPPKSIHTVLYK